MHKSYVIKIAAVAGAGIVASGPKGLIRAEDSAKPLRMSNVNCGERLEIIFL